MKVPAGKSLKFSYVGYIAQTVKVGDKSVIDIVLEENSKALDEVVVVGYAVQKKVNLSGSVATVSTKAIEDRPVLNMGQALQVLLPTSMYRSVMVKQMILLLIIFVVPPH